MEAQVQGVGLGPVIITPPATLGEVAPAMTTSGLLSTPHAAPVHELTQGMSPVLSRVPQIEDSPEERAAGEESEEAPVGEDQTRYYDEQWNDSSQLWQQ